MELRNGRISLRPPYLDRGFLLMEEGILLFAVHWTREQVVWALTFRATSAWYQFLPIDVRETQLLELRVFPSYLD